MSAQLQNISISAPGFFGLNTEDSPLDQPQAFASICDNAVIDEGGRVGSRKGYIYDTTTSTPISGSRGITTIHEFTSAAGVAVTLSTGNSLILTGEATLVDATGAATISADDWQIVELNDLVYFFQSGYAPLFYSPVTTVIDEVSAHASYTGTVPQANCVLATQGRLFAADVSGDRSTIYWTDLLQGFAWSGGTAGSINVSKFWSNGADNIVAIHEHNNKLVVFGEKSILIYTGINSPSTMVLSDTIDNVGCVGRDTIQSIGNDLIFLSHGGVMSLSRAVAGENNSIGNVSQNIRTAITTKIDTEVLPIKSVYSPEEYFYLLTFPTQAITYCFDMRSGLEDGSFRATTWSSIKPLCFHRSTTNGTIRIGMSGGISTYTGYNDNADGTYILTYISNPMDFGSPANIKFLKKVVTTVLGAAGSSVALQWGYDFASTLSSETLELNNGTIAEFGLSEFAVGEFTAGVILNKSRSNTDGSGINVSVGIEAAINGSLLSIQQLDIHALMGRIY